MTSPDTERVYVELPSGEVGTISKGEAASIEEGDAGRILSPEEAAAHEQTASLREKYGGVIHPYLAARAGELRGLTAGLSDPAILALGGLVGGSETERSIRGALGAYKELYPGATIGGEISGVASGLALGRLGVPAGPGVIGRAGALAARGVAAAIPRAPRVVPAIVSAATEGAAYGVGEEISDSAIKDHPLTAERLMAAGMRGMWIGGLVGGGVSAAGTVLGSTTRAVVGPEIRKNVTKWLDDKSAEIISRVAGGTKAMAEKAERVGPGWAGYGRIWRDELPELLGKNVSSRADMLAGAQLGVAKHGQRLGSLLDEASGKLGPEDLPKALSIADMFDRQASRIGGELGGRPAATKLRELGDDLRRVTGVVDASGAIVAPEKTLSLRELRDFRVQLDSKVWPGGRLAPELEGFRKELYEVRSSLEDTVESGVERGLGKKGAEDYSHSKRHFQAFIALDKAARKGIAGIGTNRVLGLAEQISGAAGAAIGAAVIGGIPGAVVGGAVSGVLAHQIRTRGPFVMAESMRKLGRLAAIEESSALMERQMREGVRRFLTSAVVTHTSSPKTRIPQDQLPQAALQLHAIVKDPQVYVGARIGPLGDHAPNISRSLATKMTTAYGVLSARSPSLHANTPTLQPHLIPLRLSNTSGVPRFQRALEVVDNPLRIFERMREGSITKDEIEVLKGAYPEMYTHLREVALEEISTLKDELPYEKKVAMGILLDTPAHSSQTPEFLAAMLETVAVTKAQAAPSGGAAGGGTISRRPMKLDVEAWQTPAEQIASP